MAHADYDCCAICDKKMEYKGADKALTKEHLCDECKENTGWWTVSHVLEHLQSLPDPKALLWLHEVSFSPCYFPNELDVYLINRGLVETKAPEGKWGKHLKPL